MPIRPCLPGGRVRVPDARKSFEGQSGRGRGGGQEGALLEAKGEQPGRLCRVASGPLPGAGIMAPLEELRGLPPICPSCMVFCRAWSLLLLVHLSVVHLLVGSDR